MKQQRQDKPAQPAAGADDKPAQPAAGTDVQGEGNYEASRRHQRAAHKFVEENDIEKLARDAAPRDPAEREALERAEREGRSHAAPNSDEESEQDADTKNEPPAIKRSDR
jgi:hypothetical protein